MIRTITTTLLLALAAATVSTQPSGRSLMANRSTITYRLTHTLHTIEAVSHDAHVTASIDPATGAVRQVSAVVDVTTFDSGNSNRDSHAMEVVDALTFPEASFVSTGVRQQGDSLFVTGAMTFHGVTRDVQMTGKVEWKPGALAFQGGFDLSLTAFDVKRPSLLLIPVDDILRFDLAVAFQLQ